MSFLCLNTSVLPLSFFRIKTEFLIMAPRWDFPLPSTHQQLHPSPSPPHTSRSKNPSCLLPSESSVRLLSARDTLPRTLSSWNFTVLRQFKLVHFPLSSSSPSDKHSCGILSLSFSHTVLMMCEDFTLCVITHSLCDYFTLFTPQTECKLPELGHASVFLSYPQCFV